MPGGSGVAAAMNIVVITAVLSCLNSGLYTASRMLFALAYQGNAPKALLRTNRRGVPARAILFRTIVGYLSIIMECQGLAAARVPVLAQLVRRGGPVHLRAHRLLGNRDAASPSAGWRGATKVRMRLFPRI